MLKARNGELPMQQKAPKPYDPNAVLNRVDSFLSDASNALHELEDPDTEAERARIGAVSRAIDYAMGLVQGLTEDHGDER
jgi:hypothetical protein